MGQNVSHCAILVNSLGQMVPNESGQAAGSLPTPADPPSSVNGTPCADSTSSLPPPIPDYELLRPIGQGSYGEVWLARNILGELRAIKVIYRSRFIDPRPFEREFEGIQRFEPISRSHPSQLAILHVGKNDAAGCFYYVMELADEVKDPKREIREPQEIRTPHTKPTDGRIRTSDLYRPHTIRHDLEQSGRLPISECVQIGLSLTTALAHLHDHGLVHRDIKPSNVIFVNGVPKLGDIGLVTEAGDTQSIVGTEGYIPPEGPGTPQADIFSLGKVLYEISTGMDRRRFAELPQDLREWPDRKEVVEFNEILLRACAGELGKRYRAAREVQDDLTLLQAGKSLGRQRAWRVSLSYAKQAALPLSAAAVALAVFFALPARKPRGPAIEWSKNEAANEAYRNARLAFDSGSGDGFTQAPKLLERAIELDPNFAEAYACLAHILGWFNGGDDPQTQKRAQAMAEKALSLNNKLDDAHRAIGWSKTLLERDWEGAEREYKLALRLNPNSESNLYGYANFLVTAGRFGEAVQLVERALRLDPHSILCLQNAGLVFCYAHQYDRAIEKFEDVVEKEPSSRVRIAPFLAISWREKGDYFEAVRIEEEAASLKGEGPEEMKARFDILRDAYRQGGQKAYWQQKLDWSKKDEGFILGTFGAMDSRERKNPVWLASLYARVGDKDKAFHYLDVAFEEKPTPLTRRLNRDPSFDSLRADPRFADLLTKLGLRK
jgi:serine/threonine protein kinase